MRDIAHSRRVFFGAAGRCCRLLAIQRLCVACLPLPAPLSFELFFPRYSVQLSSTIHVVHAQLLRPAASNRARPCPCSAGQNAFANSANPSSLPGLPSLFPSASSFLAPPCSSRHPQELSSALVAYSIASPCRTTFPLRSTRRPTRPPRLTFPTRAWPTLTCSRASSRPSPILHRTRTRRPQCSPHTRIRLPKASRATRAIAALRKALRCRCRPSICRQYVCKMDSSPRRNLSSRPSPWDLHSHHHNTACSNTTLTQGMRSPDSP